MVVHDALLIPKYVARDVVLRVHTCLYAKLALALIHLSRGGYVSETESRPIVISPESLATLLGSRPKTVWTALELYPDRMTFQFYGAEQPVLKNFEVVEFANPRRPNSKHKLRKLKLEVSPILISLGRAEPGFVKIAAAEFAGYENRAAVMMRLRMGVEATKRIFDFSVPRDRVEWATGSNVSMSSAIDTVFNPAESEINRLCCDFEIMSADARRRSRAPGAHISRIDYRCRSIWSKRLSKKRQPWNLPEGMEGHAPPVQPKSTIRRLRPAFPQAPSDPELPLGD